MVVGKREKRGNKQANEIMSQKEWIWKMGREGRGSLRVGKEEKRGNKQAL